MSQRILLVEDDERLSARFELALAEAGHWVVRARSGLEALSRLTPKAPPVDLVITEIGMGAGPSGWQVGRRARARRPDMPVIYMAEAGGGAALPKDVPLGVLLARPFPISQLVEMAGHLLAAQAGDRMRGPGRFLRFARG
jgi:DNA-binding NtrC family response regulator